MYLDRNLLTDIVYISFRFSKYAMLWVMCVITSQTLAYPHHYSTYRGHPIAHRAVVENAASEALYPEHLKNPFYKSPR